VKKIVALSTLRGQLTEILLPQLTDSVTSIADTGIPDNDVASSVGEASNSSASATITITWRIILLPDE